MGKDIAVEIITIQVRVSVILVSFYEIALQNKFNTTMPHCFFYLDLDYRGRYWRGGGSYSPQGYRGSGPPNYYNPRDPRQGARLYRSGMQQAGPGGYQPGRPYLRPRFHPYARGGGGGWADDHSHG